MDVTINSVVISVQTRLPKDVCDAIVNQYGSRETQEAHVRNLEDQQFKYETDDIQRKTDIHWIPETEWIAGMVSYYVNHLNDQHFRYDISGISGGHFQYSVYTEGGHYDWHNDESRNLYYVTQKKETVRKLSFSLQLSDSDDYDGGDLMFRVGESEENTKQSRERGTLVVFDSRQSHKVSPVTRGVRHALVGWFTGPVWR